MQKVYNNEVKVKKYGFPVRQQWTEMKDREIDALVADREIPNNQIKTAKYTFLTFFPLNLMFQFSKLANAYFLIIGAMQTINAISITGGQPVIFGPLVIVVGLSMIKDFFEDYKCHKSDNEENTKPVAQILVDGGIKQVNWSELCVGDVIRVMNQQYLPADIVVIGSSDGSRGRVFVETKSLDGETNLKSKMVAKELRSIQQFSVAQIRIQYEGPNPYLDRFNGSLNYQKLDPIPLGPKNFLLRGSKLMNTGYVDGIVAYTGHDTKIMLNSTKGRLKKSRLETLMNYLIIQIFLLQMVMCLFAGIYSTYWQEHYQINLSYLELANKIKSHSGKLQNVFIQWGSWILIFTNFVPISMLVSLEMVKFVQGIRMVQDPPTYTQQTDIAMTVQSSNLNEELGQVSHIFSDKTGTLTQNLMDFKCLTVSGQSYDQNNMSPDQANRLQKLSNVDFHDIRLFNALKQQNDEQLKNFMLCLSLCHTITAQRVDSQICYNATSPDELALINFASVCGYVFQGQDDNDVSTLNIYKDALDGRQQQPERRQFKVLQVLEFSSARKRMSVIVQLDNGSVILFTKGADSVIQKRLKKEQQQSYQQQSSRINSNREQITYNHINEYSRVGLRTLVLAMRVIPSSAYNQWAIEYRRAQNAIEDRERLIESIQDQIEVELELLGGTAIEDKLQDDISSTILALRGSGMKIWVLTGDKVETAINIGKSCSLLDDDMDIIVIDGVQQDQIELSLGEAYSRCNNNNIRRLGLVVTGDALIQIMMRDSMIDQLMRICDQNEAVMCCRVSPKQKAEVVQMVRKAKPQITTLAIGDGANDVNMITAAHVGIGIRGVEGQQAARSSDYAIGQFKILRRLTLFHGRECYRRNALLNMLLVLPQFWWAFHNGFSAVTLYDPIMYQSYNMFFTALPIVMFAIFDEEFSGGFLEHHPELYVKGLKDSLFNSIVFIGWIFSGAIQAFIEGYITYPLIDGSHRYNSSVMSNSGRDSNLMAIGTIILGFSVLNSNLKIVLFSNTYTPAIIIVFMISLLSFIIMYILISMYMVSADVYNTLHVTYLNPITYLVWLIIIGSTTMIDMAQTRWNKFNEIVGSQYQKQTDEV